jgi:hypothetical protein
MTGRLRRYKRDPQGLGRGAGTYYHRGKGVYSKYSPKRDKLIIATRTPQARHGYHHTGDVWAAIRQAILRGKATGSWEQPVRTTIKELSRITQIPEPKLELWRRPKTRRVRGGVQVTKGRYHPPKYTPVAYPTISVARVFKVRAAGIEHEVTGTPVRTAFHEFGHHIHFTKRKPFAPDITEMHLPWKERPIEQLAMKFEGLYGKVAKHILTV